MKATLMLSNNGNFVRKAHTENLFDTVRDIYTRLGHDDVTGLAHVFMDAVADLLKMEQDGENEDTGMMIEFIIH